jgi:NitT/TauT family transport system ATP-binding protein
MSSSPMVVVDGVSKRFRAPDGAGDEADDPARYALRDVSFNVARGECVSLLGPSGCGKTTLLRMVAGLMQPSMGTITVAGARVERPQRDRCMVFQHFGLLPWRTVLDNVAFPLELDGMPAKERLALAADFLKLVGLSGYAQHYPHQISGGMQQRVGIARALAREPILLMMDEPFGALDSQTREQLQDEFLRIWQITRKTVLLVTHAIDEAILLSRRIIVMTAGPGCIKETVDVPFPMEDREPKAIRASAAFTEQSAFLRNLLRH